MNIVIIIQARMGSTRLPGKVLYELVDKTVLAHVIDRAKAIIGVTEIVIATTIGQQDDPIVQEARKLGVTVYRGSESDVLSRYYEVAKLVRADAVVRITSDCPMLDPEVSSNVVATYSTSNSDYVSNTLERTFPRGLDTEVFSFDSLETAYREAQAPHDREHVTPYIYNNRDRFVCRSFRSSAEIPEYRWTLDTPEDWELITRIYESIYHPDVLFSWKEAAELIKCNPEWAAINAHIEQKQ